MVVLSIKANKSSDCKSFNFFETTDSYDVSNNPNGWGAPNEVTGDATAATLTISNLTTSVQYDDIDLFATGNFPTTDTTIFENIDYTDLLVGGVQQLTSDNIIPDGIYKFLYNVTTSTRTYTQACYITATCNILCCIKKLANSVEIGECDKCNESDSQRFLEAYAQYKAMMFSAAAGNISQFNNQYSCLTTFCDDTCADC